MSDETLDCKECGDIMVKKREAKHSQGMALFFIIGGIILCFGLPPVGIILFFVGIYLGCGSRSYWVCSKCGHYLDAK